MKISLFSEHINSCMHAFVIQTFIHSFIGPSAFSSHCAWRLGESGCHAVERAVEVVQRGEQGVLRGFELQLTVDQIN